MKLTFYIILICSAYIMGKTMPKLVEGEYKLQQAREYQEFVLQFKGVQEIHPKLPDKA